MEPFELMESMMQVSMVEDDKPLDLNTVDEEMEVNAPAVPTIESPSVHTTDEELVFYKQQFRDIEQIKFMRLHCTGCNVHIGTAPFNQSIRYEHPLLKVLICESCYNFYTSGDFEKDEDGSELYCRWCGQGGVVYCCARCPFVFCKKCIKRNIGRAMVAHIENSDDWLCYACNPNDIMMLRALCWAIREYSNMKMSIPPEMRTSEDVNEINSDKSLCCKRGQNRTPLSKAVKIYTKQKKSAETDIKTEHSSLGKPLKSLKLKFCEIFDETGRSISPPGPTPAKLPRLLPKPPVPQIMSDITTAVSIVTDETGDEVVCTPDIIAIDDSPPNSPRKASEPQKQAFLQVKPPSKLLDPKKEHKSKYKTIQYPQNHPNSNKIQTNTIVSTMVNSLQQKLVNTPGEPPKVIKIVSPDGRSFFIDPSKVDPTNNAVIIPQGPPPPPLQIIQSLMPVPSLSPITQLHTYPYPSPKWFKNALGESQKISQTISNSIVNLVQEQTKIPPNYCVLYTSFQTTLKSIIDKIESIKEQMRNDYISWLNTRRGAAAGGIQADFGQHFLWDPVFGNEPIPEPFISDQDPRLSYEPQTQVAQNSTIVTVENSTVPIQTELNPESNDSPNKPNENGLLLRTILSTNSNGNKSPTCDENKNGDTCSENASETKDSKGEKLNCNISENEVQDIAIGEIKALKDKLEQLEKALEENKMKDKKCKVAKRRNSQNDQCVLNHNSDVFDDIFDMDVTCDSDEEQLNSEYSDDAASVYSIKSSDSDSDCMVVTSGTKSDPTEKDLDVSAMTSTSTTTTTDGSSQSKISTEANENTNLLEKGFDNELKISLSQSAENHLKQSVNEETPKSNEVSETVFEKVNECEKEETVGSERTDNDNKNVSSPLNGKNEVENSEEEIEETLRNGDETEVKIKNTEDSEACSDSSEKNFEICPPDTIAIATTSGTLKSQGSHTVNQNFTNSLTDLVSIAQALRESMKESGLKVPYSLKPSKLCKPRLDDLEMLLSSNVVFRKTSEPVPCKETEAENELESTSSQPEKQRKRFVDAFSNFVASSSEAAPSSSEVVEEEQMKSNETNGSPSITSPASIEANELVENSIHNDTDLKELDSGMAVLQKLAENCIPGALSKETPSEASTVEC